MSEHVVVPDFNDPCAAYEEVRKAYYRLLAGGTPTWVEIYERRVRFTDADAPRLEKLMGELKAECEAKNGRRKRYAMGATFRVRG